MTVAVAVTVFADERGHERGRDRRLVFDYVDACDGSHGGDADGAAHLDGPQDVGALSAVFAGQEAGFCEFVGVGECGLHRVADVHEFGHGGKLLACVCV
jgi:hypothetical protein